MWRGTTVQGGWDTNWQYRRKLTFDNSAQATNLQSFPVLIRLNSLRVSYAATQDLGQDVRFLDTDETVLSHEIEEWNESGDSLVWVKVPQIDSGSTTDFIWMYYGNGSVGDGQDAQNVWDNNFMLVWHLSDYPTASVGDYDLNDSARNTPLPNYGNGISTTMDASNRVSAKIAGGIAFNGTDEWLNLDSPDPGFYHDAFTTKTCEAWIRCNNPA